MGAGRSPLAMAINHRGVRIRSSYRRRRNLWQILRIRIEEEDAEELGYRVIFPEEMERLIRRLLKQRPRAEREKWEQLELFVDS